MAFNFCGIHTISSALSQSAFLFPLDIGNGFSRVIAGGTQAPEVPVQWNFVPVGNPGSNLYTIRHGENNEGFLFFQLENELLFMSTNTSLANATEFSLEPDADDPMLSFHSSNRIGEDTVWTLDNVGDQVAATTDQGLRGQRWTLDGLD